MFNSVVLSQDQSPLQLAEAFAELARELAAKSTLEETLTAITGHAVTMIDGAEDASITVMRREGSFLTVAATSDRPRQVDAIQYESGEGPCLATLLDAPDVTRSDDLAADSKWPVFGPRASQETGVHSMLAYRLFLEDHETIGSLNIYSAKRAAFAPSVLPVGNLLATHSAIAFARAQDSERADNLHTALESNRTIGTAIGILMARHLVTQEQAFDLLRVVSQRTHRKIADIAVDVVDTGTLDAAGVAAEPS